MDIRDQLIAILAERGLSARQVSLEAGLSDSLLHKFLTGNIKSLKTDTLKAIAGALKLPLSDLLVEPDPEGQELRLEGAVDHYLIEWRQHRNMTQAEVVERLCSLGSEGLPKTAASLSRIENGKQPYSQPILEALAEVYKCSPSALIGSAPAHQGAVSGSSALRGVKERTQGKNVSNAGGYLRDWRIHRGLTQQQLADAIGTTANMILYLENGERGLSEKWLRKLGPALGTTAGKILDEGPAWSKDDIYEVWSQIADKDRPRAFQVLRAFLDG